jgi:hypothetical protein
MCLPSPLCSYLAWFTFQPLIWKRNIPPKRRWTFVGIHSDISQKTKLSVTTDVRNSICNILDKDPPPPTMPRHQLSPPSSPENATKGLHIDIRSNFLSVSLFLSNSEHTLKPVWIIQILLYYNTTPKLDTSTLKSKVVFFVKIMVFWTVMPCCLVESSNVLQELIASVSGRIQQGYIIVVFWIMTVLSFIGYHQKILPPSSQYYRTHFLIPKSLVTWILNSYFLKKPFHRPYPTII